MLALTAIAFTFAFFVATLYYATQGRVKISQECAGVTFMCFGVCLLLDGSKAWATGLILLGAVVIALAGKGD